MVFAGSLLVHAHAGEHFPTFATFLGDCFISRRKKNHIKCYSSKGRIGPDERAQWVKVLATKSDCLSSILRTPMMVGQNYHLKVVLGHTHEYHDMCV